MSGITTHVLDTARGRPAAGVPVMLERSVAEGWQMVGAGATDGDGRLRSLMPDTMSIVRGTYRLTFDTRQYFDGGGVQAFYPRIIVEFDVAEEAHYHVPLLLSPYGYSTYRGS
jgi:5-hydroxyisourate hydrolase